MCEVYNCADLFSSFVVSLARTQHGLDCVVIKLHIKLKLVFDKLNDLIVVEVEIATCLLYTQCNTLKAGSGFLLESGYL